MEAKVIKVQLNGKVVMQVTYTVTETIKVENDVIDGGLMYETIETRDNHSLDQKWDAIEKAFKSVIK